jgi:hypothetical protein
MCWSILVDVMSVTSCDGKCKASSGLAHTKDVFKKLAHHNKAEKECKSKLSQQEVKHHFWLHQGTSLHQKWDIWWEAVSRKVWAHWSRHTESERALYIAELRSGYDATPYMLHIVQNWGVDSMPLPICCMMYISMGSLEVSMLMQ